ncbi:MULTISPECIES: ABC transporter ATP-binding protein [Cytobacillus]|uniref:Quaternary amine transport ATP-binding protein n=1 Tax=Cytobacillus stercorigallinarum TaxID=2762240 RepID=A0ABR8QIX4_9BACI|nr:ABC transporter ATP-binding protein [Cytobacillus stercorigallinarum]MBD7935473.1 ABC transporter ATP-binding protein [Cytobacillus stercorigallinarum]
MITFAGVSKAFGEKEVVNSLDFSIEKGELFVLIGPSGCGKTTTLKMINRLEETSGGSITINERNIRDYALHDLRYDIGYVLQQIALFPHMTVEENIAIVPELKRWDKSKIHQRVTELLELVGLEPGTYRNRKPAELSGGQQQRVGVARALAANPEVILMDEPFSALDPITRVKLQDDLLLMKRNINKTIVFVTHDMTEALKLGDRIAVMNEGGVVQIGTPEELRNQPESQFVEEFISSTDQTVDPFDIKHVMIPFDTGDGSISETVTTNISKEQVLNQLVTHEKIAVQENGALVGMITRESVIQFLATQAKDVGGRV